jgi:membrane protein required for colicin V production
LNTLDIILAVALLIGLVNGYQKGFVKGLIDLLAIITGIIAAIWLTGPVVGIIKNIGLSQSDNLPVIVGLIILILVLVMAAIISDFLKKLIKVLFLKPIDSLLGSALGLFTTTLFISLVFWIIDIFDLFNIQRENSTLLAKIENVSATGYGWLRDHIPAIIHFEEVVKSFLNS